MPPIVIVLPIIGAVTFDLAAVALTLATNVLIGLATTLLFGKPTAPEGPKPGGLSQTIKGSTEARKIIYGEVLTGGVLVYAETGPNSNGKENALLHTVIALAGHECDSISDVYLDDKLTTDPMFFADNSGAPLVLVNKHLGSDTQTVDTTLQAAIPKWDATHRLLGVCYLYVQLSWQNQPVTFRAGIPNVRGKVKGKKLYDPRTGATVWSNNPALAIRDYLTSSYGFGVTSAEIDDSLVIAAANVCDETVGGQKRYTCDGVISLDEKPLDVLEDLAASMAGAVVYSQGKFRIYAGAAGTKTVTIDRTWLRDKITVDARLGRQDLFNAVRGTFTDPTKDWQAADFHPVVNSTYTAQDGGEQIYRDIQLRFTVDSTGVRPQRIAKIALEKSRQGIKVTVPCNFSALQIAPWDVIGITEPLLGWDDKNFRVLTWTLAEGGGVDLVCQEEAAASYNWNNGDATTVDPAPDTNLNNPFRVAAPGTPMVTETLIATRSGAGVASLATVTWGESADAFAYRYRVQYKLHSASTWKLAGDTEDLSFEIQDIPAGTYDFRVAAINSFGTLSAWSQVTKQLLGLTAPPTDVAGFRLTALAGQAHLRWTRATDLDVLNGGHVVIRHTPVVVGASWSSSIDVNTQLAGNATEATVPLLTGTYLAKFVDSSGNFSINAAEVITTLPDLLSYNVVLISTQSPTFAGTKSGLAVDGGALTFAPPLLVDDLGLVDDVFDWDAGGSGALVDAWGFIDGVLDWDEEGTTIVGTYLWDSTIDLGAAFTSRLTAAIQMAVFRLTDLFDSRLDDMDSWADFDGIVVSGTGNALLEVRTTTDDPGGSPVTWGPWTPFLIGDYYARAFQFRLTLSVDDPTYTIQVTQLAVTIDMPDRVQSGQSTSSSSGNTTVTFPAAFKGTDPRVGFTIWAAATGDYIDLVSVSATGFVYSVRNSSGSRVAKTVDWIAKGY